MEKLRVVSPLGLEAVQPTAVAPRIADLDGKTVGEIWNGVFRGDVTFPLIRKRLLDRFPTLKIVPYTEFPHVPGADNPAAQRERAREIAALVKEKQCDAVISGNGA